MNNSFASLVISRRLNSTFWQPLTPKPSQSSPALQPQMGAGNGRGEADPWAAGGHEEAAEGRGHEGAIWATRGIRNWKLNGKLNSPRKFKSPRYCLYRSQILQETMRWKALAESYTMHSFAPFLESIITVLESISEKWGKKDLAKTTPKKGENKKTRGQ